ncbi:MAG TPA: hypothetical protein VGL93_06685 [Streptosporangiaceae bacterium]|jgi:lysylphosphatidylglycerol synthetase-like protein (DUF2156 family)
MEHEARATEGDGGGASRGWATGLSVTGAAVLFLMLRLFAITRYDWHTAFAIVDTIQFDDAPSVVLGTLMADQVISGSVLMLLLPFAVVRQTRFGLRDRSHDGHLAWLITLVVATLALVVTYRAWWLLGGAAVIAAVLVVLLRTRDRGGGRTAVLWIMRQIGVLTVLAALVIAATVRTPWVPLERIATKAGVIQGYVLETPSGYLKVLSRDEREMVIVETSDVTSRHECEDERC